MWRWDVTYVPTLVRGQIFYLYLIIDIYSRMIMGYEIFEFKHMANTTACVSFNGLCCVSNVTTGRWSCTAKTVRP